METNQQTARALLERRRDGYSIWRTLRGTTGRYILWMLACICFIVAAMLSDNTGFRVLCAWAFGMFAGAMIRDVGWLRAIKSKWPFMCELLDWSKVEAMAAEDDAGDGTSDAR